MDSPHNPIRLHTSVLSQPTLFRQGSSYCSKQHLRVLCSASGSLLTPPQGCDSGGPSFRRESRLLQPPVDSPVLDVPDVVFGASLPSKFGAGAVATNLRVYIAAIAARRDVDKVPLGRHRLLSSPVLPFLSFEALCVPLSPVAQVLPIVGVFWCWLQRARCIKT